MPEKELIITIDELKRAEIKCQRSSCSGSLTLDFTENQQPDTACPVCNKPVAVAIHVIGNAWNEFYKHAVEAKLQFRVKQ